MGNLILPILILVGMWALLIMPQQRRMKAHKALIASADEGDRILMASGIYGTISEVLEVALYVEIAEGIEIMVSRSQITEILDEFPTESALDLDAIGLDDEVESNEDPQLDEAVEDEA